MGRTKGLEAAVLAGGFVRSSGIPVVSLARRYEEKIGQFDGHFDKGGFENDLVDDGLVLQQRFKCAHVALWGRE